MHRPTRPLLLVVVALVTALIGLSTAPATAHPSSAPGQEETASVTVPESADSGSESEPDSEPGSTDAEAEETHGSIADAGTTNMADPIAGEVTRIAGQSGTSGAGYSGDDGPAADARLNDMLDVAAAPDGTIHIADPGNGRVRSIDPDGVITTTVHAMRSPENDVDLDVEGWIYSPSNRPISVAVADDGAVVVGADHDVSRMSPGEDKEVLAGGDEGGLPAPGDSAPGDSFSLHRAEDVAVTSDGTVYAYLSGVGEIIEIDPEGEVRLLAGGGKQDRDDADGTRPATDYAIGLPQAIAVAESGPLAGTVFFTAEKHSRVMAINPDGTLDVFAGTTESGFGGDGGPARDAQLSEQIEALGVTEDGEVLIGDTFNAAIRRVDADGVITTLRGAVGQIDSLDVLPDGDVVFTRGSLVLQLTVEGTPALEVDEAADDAGGADPFAQEPAGEVVHLAGAAGEAPDSLPQRNEYDPVQAGVAVDTDGNVLFGDSATATVQRVEDDGSTTVVAGVWPLNEESAADTSTEQTVTADEHPLENVSDLATLPDGTVAIAEHDQVWLLQDNGTMTQLAVEGEKPSSIRGIAADDDGAIYLAAGDVVQRVAPDGTVETIAGGGELWAHEADGHPATEANLWQPADVAVDSEGTVYLTETGLASVRQIASDGTLTTVLGDSYRRHDEGGFSGDGGPASEAEVNSPVGLLVAPDDQVYVADTYNARVRRINSDGTVTTVAGNGLLPEEEPPDGQSADGLALETALGEPTSLALDTDGDLLVSTDRPERIYRLTGDDELRMVAETAPESADPETPAEEALLPAIQDLAVSGDGVLHLSGPRGMVTIDGTAGEPDGQEALSLVSGDLTAVTGKNTVSRVLPDGRTVLVAGGGGLRPDSGGEAIPAQELDLNAGVRDIALSLEGSLFILALNDEEGAEKAAPPLYEVTREGMVTEMDLAEGAEPQSIAAGPDGAVYGIAADNRQIQRLDGQDGGVVAAMDEENTDQLVDEPHGTATALPYDARLHDLAVGPDGDLFVAVDQGLLVVDPEEDTYALHDELWSGPQGNLRVAADQHGNAYALSLHEGGQLARVSALVRPTEVTAPQEVPWAGITAAGGGAAVVLGAVLLWRRRRGIDPAVGSPQDQPTAHG